MSNPATTPERRPEEEDEKERRKRARRILAAIRGKVDLVCRNVDRIGDFVDEIQQVVDQVRAFTQDEQLGGLLPQDIRQRLLDGADRFDGIHQRIDQFEAACSNLRQVLDAADKLLASPSMFMRWLAGTAAVAVIGAIVGVVLAQTLGGDNGGQPPVSVATATPIPFVPTATFAPASAAPTATPTPAGIPPASAPDRPTGILGFAPASGTLIAGSPENCTLLEWDAGNATSVFLNRQPVEPAAAVQVCPAQTTTWTLTAVYSDGSTDNQQATVEVVEPPPQRTIRFLANPDTVVPSQNQPCTVLIWTAPDSEAVFLDGKQVDTSGELEVCPTVDETWLLEVQYPDGGVEQRQATVMVR